MLSSSLPASSGLEDADCRFLAPVVWYGDVEPPRLGNEQRRTSPCISGDLAERLVIVGPCLREGPDGAVPARDVDALGRGVVEDVVGGARGVEAGEGRAYVGV